MKGTRTLTIMALAAITLLAPVGIANADPAGQPDHHPTLSMEPGRLPMLNNVVSMDARSGRQAVCPCGRQFSVGPEQQSIDRDGSNVFVCSDRCADAAISEAPGSFSAWSRSVSSRRLATNLRMKQGFETGACPCGKSFVLHHRGRAVVDNGLIVFFCAEECRSRFRTMGPEERMAAELRMLPLSPTAQPSVQLTYCLLPTAEGGDQGCATVTYRLTDNTTVIAAEPPIAP